METPDPLARRLEGHVVRLAGEIGERNVYRPQALAAAADYIDAAWRVQGYDVSRQWYTARGVRCANLEVARQGHDAARGILLLGAHYDTMRGTPGADDNASGVAALLELSRHLAGLSPAATVRFVAFVNEEFPFFMTGRQGSMVYATAARRRRDDIRLMISLEMLGYYSEKRRSQHYPPPLGWFYPDRGNFIAFVSNLRSRREMRRAADCFRERSAFPIEQLATIPIVPGISWSDHRSFWRRGFRAFMVTDTAFFRYRHYHSARDTPDRLTYPAFARVTEGLGACIAALAGA